MRTSVGIFCAYSHEDAELVAQFKHVIEKQGIAHQWYDRVISSEAEWQNDIDENLERAELIILGVSAGLISSGYCSGQEMAAALALHDAGKVLVIPLILRPSIWQATPLRRLDVLPKEGRPVTTWEKLNQAWANAVEGILRAIDVPLLGPFYRDLCTRGRSALLKQTVDIAPFLDNLTQDNRLGLTLIVRPSAEVAECLTAIVNDRLKHCAPLQFYYDKPRFHFTILSMISAFDPSKVSRGLAIRYGEPSKEVLGDFTSFEVQFSGICATPNSIIAQGFPVDDKLERIRDALRERLHAMGLGSGLDERYRIQGAHITLGRFRLREDFMPLIEVLDQLSDIPLGSMRVQHAQLVMNDFYMSQGKVQLVAEFPLGSTDNTSVPSSLVAQNVIPDVGDRSLEVKELADTLANEEPRPTVGIMTALPKEYTAVKVMLENPIPYLVPGGGAGRQYLLGELPAANGGRHSLVLSLADMGNNIAATRATLLLEHFPSVKSIIMVGIAGGVPNPKKPDEHVRLGDVVVLNQKGVVQYDFDKETITETVHRHPPRPPSASLLEAVRLLEAAEVEGKRPWLRFIDQAMNLLKTTRPSEETDTLVCSTNSTKAICHPRDIKRIKGRPRVFIGPVASANKLLKNPVKRDELRCKFGVKAVEMEGSGIADATWNHEVGYLVVRGICDYCDSNKGDDWQDYAAVVAAAYTRALLESIPSQAKAEKRPESPLLHNLPIKPTNVVGRRDEYEYILDALSEADKPVILASGFGGIGKSTVAKMVGWTCVEQKRPFNLIVWIDARKYSKTISLGFVLDQIAKVAGDGDIPTITDLDAKQDQVRVLLKSHRSLIILDNHEHLLHHDLEGEQEVCAFLDSLPIGPMIVGDDTYIRVLVTTREVSAGLKGLPIDNVQLQKLPLKDSLELMRSRTSDHVKLTEDQYERVWTLLCGLPKYMEIAIEQLKSFAFEAWEKNASGIEARFSEGERIFESDEFFRDLFRDSWKIFPESFRKILLSMAHFVGEASHRALQRTSGLSETQFRDELLSASDAYIESTGSGYTVHPLTHAFCQTMLNSTDFKRFYKESGQRFVDYFLEFAKQSCKECKFDELEREIKNKQRKFDELEREIRNIVAAANLAEKLKLWDRLIKFQESTADFFRFRGYWHEQIEITLHAANACRALVKERELANYLVHDLGWLLLRLEDLCRAERYVNEGLKLFRKLDDQEGVAQALRHLGKSALLKGLDDEYKPNESWDRNAVVAERYYQQSLELREVMAEEGLDQRTQIGDMKLDFGRLYWLWGIKYERDGRQRKSQALIETALETYEKANAISREAKDISEEISNDRGIRGIAKAWGNLGNATKEIVRFMLKEDQLARAMQYIAETHEYYGNSLAIATKIERRDEIAHARWGLAEVYELYADSSRLHNRSADKVVLLEKALDYAEESHKAYIFLGGPKDIRATGELVNRIRGKLPLF